MLGKLLRRVRAGKRKLIMHRAEIADVPETIRVTSLSFVHEGKMPPRLTQSGENLSPAIEWQCLPANTCDIMVIMEDPDAPLNKPFCAYYRLQSVSAERDTGRGDSEQYARRGTRLVAPSPNG